MAPSRVNEVMMVPTVKDKTEQGRLWSTVAIGRTSTHASESLPLYESVFERANCPPGSRYLDAGCGSGEGCELASRRGFEVYGVDPSEAMISEARRRSPTSTFHIGSAEALEFPDMRFSLLTAINSLHFCAEPETAAREYHRVLAPGGVLAINCLAPRELSDMEGVFRALLALVPLTEKRQLEFVDPFRLAAVGVVEMVLRIAGFADCEDYYVALPLEVPDVESAIRVWQNVALYTAVAACVGTAPCDEALGRAVRPFVQPDGRVRWNHTARIVLARKT